MKHIRYYAIGHSYLKHGPFAGWQTEGFWGMAASAPETDYFHKLQEGLRRELPCEIQALAENHALYERLCTTDATRETYTSSEPYAHMGEVLREFRPNFITLFIGGGNTKAKDAESLSLFFETFYEHIAQEKPEDAVVMAISINAKIHALSEPVAKKYGHIPVDASFIHTVPGRDNPYYAFRDYPDYDEKAAAGAVEFRTHPNDRGHAAIAEAVLRAALPSLALLPEGEPSPAYEKFLQEEVPARFHVATEPKMRVSYFGFNLRQQGEEVVFGSAPDTGASLVAEDFSSCPKGGRFAACLDVEGAEEGEKLKLSLCTEAGQQEMALPIQRGMTSYEFSLREEWGSIRSLRLAPESKECVVTVRALKFES